ncbi:MAG: hypothetical protein R2734_14145 [Nocardioides sp.]
MATPLPTSAYDRLDAAPVLATIARLERRIAARFPDRGLRRVAADLSDLAADVATGTTAIRGGCGSCG